MSLKVLISGSSGFVGTHVSRHLTHKGYVVYSLSRKKENNNTIFWDPENNIFDAKNIETVDAIIHLCGENVAGYWTKKKKRRIYESRIHSTEFLIRSLKNIQVYPKVFISASAVGFYGDRKDETLTEKSSKGKGFLSDVCEDWEASANQLSDNSKVISLRFGHILGDSGGILSKLARIYRLGFGGKMGSGEQYMSWISIDDVCEVISQCITQEHWTGPINCVSINPLTQKQFGKTLSKVLHKPFWFHIPKICLRFILREQADEMFLASQRVIPEKLNYYEYRFIDTDLKQTFQKYLKK